MSLRWLIDSEVTVYVLPKVKKSFDESVRTLVTEEKGEDAEVLRLKDDLAEWVASRAHGKRWSKGRRSPSEKALSRAFQALAAARYHLRNNPEAEEELRELRDRVEAIWLTSDDEA